MLPSRVTTPKRLPDTTTISWVRSSSCKRNGRYILIDGQQRVTTLTLLLIYLYHAAEDRGLPVVSTLAPLIYSDNLGKPSFNLAIPERLPAIEALFRRDSFHA